MPARGAFVDFQIAPGEFRPALVVREWTPTCAQLQVFPDKANDGQDPFGADWFRSSASAGDAPGTWRALPTFIFNDHAATAVPWFHQSLELKAAVPGTIYETPTKGYPR